MYVTLHSGVDFGMEAPQHCTPERLHHVLQEVSGENIIAAHIGSYGYWDDVERYLVGTPVMMDTASVCEDIDPAQYKRIIQNHGADKVMFGTDSPWWTPGEAVAMLESLGLPEEDRSLPAIPENLVSVCSSASWRPCAAKRRWNW